MAAHIGTAIVTLAMLAIIIALSTPSSMVRQHVAKGSISSNLNDYLFTKRLVSLLFPVVILMK